LGLALKNGTFFRLLLGLKDDHSSPALKEPGFSGHLNKEGLPESVCYHELPTLLLQEVQKQHATIQQQSNMLQAQQNMLSELHAQVSKQGNTIAHLQTALKENNKN